MPRDIEKRRASQRDWWRRNKLKGTQGYDQLVSKIKEVKRTPSEKNIIELERLYVEDQQARAAILATREKQAQLASECETHNAMHVSRSMTDYTDFNEWHQAKTRTQLLGEATTFYERVLEERARKHDQIRTRVNQYEDTLKDNLGKLEIEIKQIPAHIDKARVERQDAERRMKQAKIRAKKTFGRIDEAMLMNLTDSEDTQQLYRVAKVQVDAIDKRIAAHEARKKECAREIEAIKAHFDLTPAATKQTNGGTANQ